MLSKASVKKPYTVWVAVIIVLILGYVSLTKMTTDLLPNINLPYAVIYTTYAGASPEEVETTLTRPIEGAMATVSNIESVSSISSENMSMVILEFAQTANMDSVIVEMRENLDQIRSGWSDNDYIGSPIILRINPDMIPVMIAAVSREDYEGAKLNTYVQNTLLSELESIEGVASVTASGGIEESVQIIIDQELIDQENVRIREAIDNKFLDARKELTDSRDEIEDGLDEIEDGKKEMEAAKEKIRKGHEELTEQLADARNQADEAAATLLEMKLAINEKLSKLTDQKAELEEAAAKLAKVIATIENLKAEKQKIEESIAAYRGLEEQIVKVKAENAEYQSELADLQAAIDETDDPAQKASLQTAMEEILASNAYISNQTETEQLKLTLSAMGISWENGETELAGKRSELEVAVQGIDASIASIEAELDLTELLSDGEGDAETALAALEEQIGQIDEGIATLNDAMSQMSEGDTLLAEGKKEINIQENNSLYEIYKGLAEVTAGSTALESTKAQLEQGLTQLDDAEEQMEDSKQEAYDGADLSRLITREMIAQILSAQNFSMPAGYITEEDRQLLVRVGDKFDDVEELKALTLMDMGLEDLEPVKLTDVAMVITVDNSDDVYASINGEPGILLTMQKQTGYSTGEVADSIKDKFDALEGQTEGLSFTPLMDQGIYIDYVIDSVFDNLLWGALLAIFVLVLFLKDIRPTAVIALSIPISLLTALVVMYFSNISINVISLSGLALGVGMLVDNSIVVIENIYRMRGEGVPVREACIKGARQVSGAILASTLTTCCVFLPIVFSEGLTKQLFVDLGLTITYSLLASLLVAMTLVPVLGSGLLKHVPEKKNRLMEHLQKAYEKSIYGALRFKVPVILVAIAALVVSGLAAVAKGTSFMPSMESTQVSVEMKAPEGSTLVETADLSEQVIDRILTIEEVDTVGAMAGSSSISSLMGAGSGSSSNENVTMYVLLNEDRINMTGAELKAEILRLTEDLPCELTVTTETMDLSALGGSGISVTVKGKELDTLQRLAGELAAKVSEIEGTENVSDGMADTTPELRIIVNKEKASEHGLTVAQVYSRVYAKLSASASSTTLSTESWDYPVYVLDGEAETFDLQSVKKLTISCTDQEGKTEEIPISDVCDFEEHDGLASITRTEQERTLSVTAAVADGYNVGLLGNEVQDIIDEMEIPEGYSMKLAGENETILEAIVELLKMLALAVIFVYLVMVAQFQSLLMPFIIMFTVPLAFTGGFLGLLIWGLDVSVICMIGFVMLTGIIVNNGIVLIDYINQLRADGMEKREAIAVAGRTRLRPILMTALTTILGLTTMSMAVGMGAELVQPMAVVTIGGLAYGTLMTLWVIPCIYDLFVRDRGAVRRKKIGKSRKKPEISGNNEEISGNIEEKVVDKE